MSRYQPSSPAEKFAALILDKLDQMILDIPDQNAYPDVIGTYIAEGITEYLLDSVTIMTTYVGIIPPAIPDPIVADNLTLTGSCAPIGKVPTFELWVLDINTKIVAGFFTGPGIIAVTPLAPVSPFTLGIGLLPTTLLQSSLGAAHSSDLNDPQFAVWTEICKGIIDWIEMIVPLPMPATTGASVGTAVPVKIIVN